MTVPEGATATFHVKLNRAPDTTITASVTRVSGDADISVLSGATLDFTPQNWDAWQTVILAAAEDADLAAGQATIRLSAPGLADKDVTAYELDNEPCGPIEVSGIIDINTTWHRTCSPYIIIGNVQVPAGVVLTIESGVEIRYTGAYEILIKGAIIGNGTATAPIVFTTSAPGVSSGATILRFADTNLANSQLSHVKLEYASYAIRIAGGSTGTLTVSNAEVKNANVVTDGGTNGSTLILLRATISGSTVQGSYAYGGPIVIQDSAISSSQLRSDNYAVGITVRGSTVTDSPFYLGCCSAKIRIETSTITGSSVEGCCGSPVNGPLEIVGSQLINTPTDLPLASVSISNSTIEYNGARGVRFGNGSITNSSVIGNNSGVGIEITGYAGYNIGGSVSITNTTITQNAVGIKITGANVVTVQSSNIHDNAVYHIENRTTRNITAIGNYWGTTDAAQIAARIYDYYDDINYGIVEYSPLLIATYDVPVLGPANPVVSVSNYAGTTADPIVSLALTATNATQMLISDDHTFPPQFTWEPFTTTKEFRSDGTKYIYAKFKDAQGNESAIAFARPRRIMYIQKSATLAGRPALLQVRVAAEITGSQGGAASALSTSQTGVAAVLNGPQVKTFYRAIGGSTYTERAMSPTGDLYSLWIPGTQTLNGIEYYFQVEDAGGNVLATLPETNPSSQPFSLPAVSQLQESVVAGQNNAVEFAVGLTVQIPAGALAGDTRLQVAPPAATPSPPPGVRATGIGYALSLAGGSTAFARPVTVTFNYADSDVAGMNTANLRAYYLDGVTVKYAGGSVDSAARTVTFQTGHFTDFFLAEGSLIYPAPVTTATLGSPVTIQASVVNYVPVQSATVYYRVGAGSAWQSLAMSKAGDTYQATIPGSDVTANGLAYYIQASDGTTTATYPAADPMNAPQVITVVTEPVVGVVKDPAGAAVPGAFVSVHDRYYTLERHDTTDAQGRFRVVGLPAGAYILEAQPPAGSPYSAAEPRTVHITDPRVSVDVGVVALTAPLLSGTVRDPAGTTAIAGATVSVHSQDYAVNQTAQTDANGVFRIGGLGTGAYTLEASPPPTGPGAQYTASLPRTVTVTVGAGYDVGIVRLTEPQVRGRVYAPDGSTPAPNAWVMIQSQDYTVHRGTNTDAGGDYRLGGLITGTYYLRASPPPGLSYTETDAIQVTVGSTPITRNLQLNAVSVRGTVYDAQNQPVAFAGVTAHNADFSVKKEASTDAQGQYSIGGLAPGAYFLEIFAPFGTGGLVSPDPIPFTVVSGQTRVVNPQFVRATKRAVGKVIKTDGSGVANVGVHAGRRDQPGYASATTDSQGDFNLSLSGGTWDLMIESGQGQTMADWAYTGPPRTVVFALDQTNEIKTITFTVTTANSRVVGSVRKPDGSVPLPYTVFIEVRDKDGAGNGGPVSSGDGSFSIPVPPGTYNVFVHCPGTRPAAKPT